VNAKTYEILAKWIGRTTGVTVEFKPDVTPCVDMQTKHIILPSNVEEKDAFASLSHLMHEAGHVRYTGGIPVKEVTQDNQIAHGVLNAIEDVRIDRHNFQLLPNIHEFYKRGVAYDVEHRKKVKMEEVPLHKKVLVNTIYELEGLREGHIKDREAEEFADKHNIHHKVEMAIDDIEMENWGGLKDKIEELMKIFGLDKLPKVPLSATGGDAHPCPACNGTGKDTNGTSCKVCGGKGTLGTTDLSDLKPNAKQVFGLKPGEGTTVGNAEMGEVALQELTRERFKAMLNIKEVRRIPMGEDLNTDNLPAYLTGDIDELFHEEQIIRKKKSRIKLLLDGSGSMDTALLDGKSRKSAVCGCAKELVKILAELEQLEGLSVDWSIAGFTGNYHPLSKENWEKEYLRTSGGTNLESAFAVVHDELVNDPELDGKRIVIVFTDGDVHKREVEAVQDRIIKHGHDVRVMVVGVGAEVTGTFVTEICGDMNILAKETADQILLEAIMVTLED